MSVLREAYSAPLTVNPQDLGAEAAPPGTAVSSGSAQPEPGVYRGSYGARLAVIPTPAEAGAVGAHCFRIEQPQPQRSGLYHTDGLLRLAPGCTYLFACRIWSDSPAALFRLSVKGERAGNLWALDLESNFENFLVPERTWTPLRGLLTIPPGLDEPLCVFIVQWDRLPLTWMVADLSLRPIDSSSGMVAAQTAPTDYPSMREEFIYRALLGTGAPLTRWEYEQIERNDKLYIPLYERGHTGLLEHLETKYRLPAPIVRYLLGVELSNFRKNLTHAPASKRANRFWQFAHLCLFEHQRHHELMERLHARYPIERRAFFDIGCKYGTSAISALAMGYQVAHCCDLEHRIFENAREIMRLGRELFDGDLRFDGNDFLQLDLAGSFYNLVLMINILEHTPDHEATIRGLAHILAPGGVACCVQGAYRSVKAVLDEPHYHLPLLTLLPHGLAIRILDRYGLIPPGKQYCVVQWPDLKPLRGLLERYGLTHELGPETADLFGRDRLLPPESANDYMERITAQVEQRLLPVVEGADRETVERIRDGYFAELATAAREYTPDQQLTYFKYVWDIVIRRPG